MTNIDALRPIIADKAFTIDEKMEMIKAALTRELNEVLREKKKEAIQRVNSCRTFDQRDARIIINNM